MKLRTIIIIITATLFIKCNNSQTYDVLIRKGKIIDGTGKTSFIGDLGINGDTIAVIGNLENDIGLHEIDAKGLVVAPGFINMLSWANAP